MGRTRFLGALCAVLGLSVGLASTAWAVDIDLTVKTGSPTNLQHVVCRVGTVERWTTGADAQTGVTLPLTGLGTGSHTLSTTFRDFAFAIAADGAITVASDSHLSVSGSTITIQNDLDLEDFEVGLRKPMGLTQVEVKVEAVHAYLTGPAVANYYTPMSTATTFSGPDGDDTPATIELLGLVPGMTLNLRTNLGASLYFVIDEAGDVAEATDSAVPLSVESDAPHRVILENDVDLTNFGIRLCQATSLDTVTYMFEDFYGPGHFLPTSTSSGNLTMPDSYVSRSKSEAHTNPATFNLTGLVPGQAFHLRSTWGTDWFTVTASGTIQRSTSYIPITISGNLLIVDNTVDVTNFRVRQENTVNADTCTFHGDIYPTPGLWISPGTNLTTTGGGATAGVSMPLTGVIAGLLLNCRSDVTMCYFRVTADGSVEPKGPWGDGIAGYWTDATVDADEDGVTLVLMNSQELWIKLYTAETPPSTMTKANYALYLGGVTPDGGPRPDRDPADLADGEIFHVKYAGPHSELSASISVNAGGAGAGGMQVIRLQPDGTATFTAGYYGPVINDDSPIRGALPVSIGGVENVFYVEFVDPPNAAPTVTLEDGDNLTILSSAQSNTTLTAALADADGDSLTCSWFVDGVPAPGTSTPSSDGECALDLGDLADLGVGEHTVRVAVSDGEFTAEAGIKLTVDNSPPDVAVGPGPVVEIDEDVDVVLTAEVGDYDGDDVTYEWALASGTVLGSGELELDAGGEPADVPPLSWPTTLLGTGTHVLTLTVDDEENDPVKSFVTVEVKDTSAPVLAPEASRLMLWPPNHAMVEVVIDANAYDASGGSVTLAATVESSEPPEFDDDGEYLPDCEVVSVNQSTGVITLNLRAERSGQGDGRTYVVTITATDASGNASTSVVEIVCPHDKGKK